MNKMSKEQYKQEHFPVVEPGAKPCGNQILVQLRTVKTTSAGGILLAPETKEFNDGNTQIGMLVKQGSIAFKDRASGQPWTEGAWAQLGDIVIVPKWGGFRFEIPVGDSRAIFAIFEDFNVKMVVEDNFEAFDRLL